MKKMKTTALTTVILIGIMVANFMTATAQVQFTIKGTSLVQINVPGQKPVLIRPGETKTISEFSCDKEMDISITYIENNSRKDVKVRKPAGQCRVDLEKTSGGIINNATASAASKPPSSISSASAPAANAANTNGVNQVKIRLLNSSGKAFSVPAGPFTGVAINPFDTSNMLVSVPTGVLNFPIVFIDTADNKQIRQVVITRIITQDMDILEIKEDDFGIAVRGKLKLYAFNETDVKFVFTNSIFSGYSLSPGGRCMKKLELSYGFQNFVIEFYGSDGLKYRANIEAIITPQDNVVRITKDHLKTKYLVLQ